MKSCISTLGDHRKQDIAPTAVEDKVRKMQDSKMAQERSPLPSPVTGVPTP